MPRNPCCSWPVWQVQLERVRFYSLIAVLAICLRTEAQPGQVYFVVGSDTAIWNAGTTVDVYTRHPHYSQDSFTVPGNPSFKVMDAAWRAQYQDSSGQPIKFTWWMMGGNIYRDADNVNVPLANTMTLHLMQKYHGDAIRQFGDELSLHYHTYFWSDYNGDGNFYWNQSRTFNECRADFDVTLAQYLLEEGVFPASFRSGWHFMDSDWQEYLNALIPYCFHDDYGVYRAWYTNEPIFGVEDWSHAPSAFVPYHPSTNDYQVPGESPGWNVRSIKMQNMLQVHVDQIFSQASNGVDQVACIWNHLPENFITNVAKIAALIDRAAANHPGVRFHYCTAVEAMQLWQGIGNQATPQIHATENSSGESVSLTISTDKAIFQPQPFVAVRDAFENYSNFSSLCVSNDVNTWTVTLPVRRDRIAKIGIAVTDLAGNVGTRILRFLPDNLYLDNLDSRYSEMQGSWISTTNAAWGTDARIALLSSKETAQVRWALPIALSGLYNLSVQVPAITNAATNILFRLFAAASNVASVSFSTGLPTGRWQFLCSAILDATITNVLEMSVVGSNQANMFAVADVVSAVPVRSDPSLPPRDQLGISSSTGRRLLLFSGEPGSLCSIQRSTNLSSGWITLDSLAVPLTGLVQYEDRNPPAGDGFYRVSGF
ncbi:MAG TPA: hypothetical protein VL361_13075 [Candidatus Limnocylindrales bacterium]|nr:hypothetical protein [Candidatus Limnocylindrales bacterium]